MKKTIALPFVLSLLALLAAACTEPEVVVAADLDLPLPTAVTLTVESPVPSATALPAAAVTLATDTHAPTLTDEPTSTPTSTPSATLTQESTATPTPIPYAVVQPFEGSAQGSTLWLSPQGTPLEFLRRGVVVVLLPGAPLEQGGLAWVQIRVSGTGQAGWLAERDLSRLVSPPGCGENTPELLKILQSGNDGHGYFLDISFGVLPGMVRYAQANFVSSGVFETLEVPLGDGETLQVDAVWAYTLPKGVLVTVPVALGARFPGGEYRLFSNAGPGGPLWPDLQTAQALLYRGRLFYALLNDFVAPGVILWNRCSAQSRHLFAGETFCRAGQAVDDLFPGASAAFLAGRQPPQGWIVFGWALGERTAASSVVWEVANMPACFISP